MSHNINPTREKEKERERRREDRVVFFSSSCTIPTDLNSKLSRKLISFFPRQTQTGERDVEKGKKNPREGKGIVRERDKEGNNIRLRAQITSRMKEIEW